MPAGPEAEPLISVCVVSGRRPKLLQTLLESLVDQQDPPPFELLVCADGDPEVAALVLAQFPSAVIGRTGGAHPGAARNLLIERARGELLLFLDDDVTVEPGMLRHLAGLASAHPEAMVIGGPNETPPHSSAFQVVQGAVLASLVGSGPVRRRYGPHPAGDADERWFILCNLAVRRHAMSRFPTTLVCAEENAVLAEMRRQGLAMLYDPDLLVYHERRATLLGFARQMRKYGFGRGQLARRDPATMRPAYLVPSALLLYLAASPALAMLSPVWLVPLVAYAGAVLAGGAWVAVTLRRPALAPLATLLFAVLHLSYGTGVLTGIVIGHGRRGERAPRPSWVSDGGEPVTEPSLAET